MTELETAICMVIDVFDKYACKEGKKSTLTKGEMKTLVEKELPGMLGNAKEKKDSCDSLLKDLDINKDCELDFQEFVVFVATLACLGQEKCEDKAPKKK